MYVCIYIYTYTYYIHVLFITSGKHIFLSILFLGGSLVTANTTADATRPPNQRRSAPSVAREKRRSSSLAELEARQNDGDQRSCRLAPQFVRETLGKP